jgi:hypothetical protein
MDNSSQNQNTQKALQYHETTKHSEESLRADTHFLDWANKPLPFKVYRGAESVPLLRDPDIVLGSTPAALDALCTPVSRAQDQEAAQKIPDLATLSQVLFLTAGITKQKNYPGGPVYFRAYSNTGAQYHIDLYLVTQDLPDLPAGHHSIDRIHDEIEVE